MISQNITNSNESVLEEELYISLNSGMLPLESLLTKVGRCIVCYCLKGWADIEVNLVKHRFSESEIIVIFPTQIVLQNNKSEDFTIMYFSLSPAMLQDVTFRFPPDFLTFLRKHFFYKVTPDMLQEEQVRFASIHLKYMEVKNLCRREILLNMLRIYFLELYNKIRTDNLTSSTTTNSRKTELFEKFINLLMLNYIENRDVLFYAQKLCISPKYLSLISYDLNGYGAKQCIDDYVILEIKLRLKNTKESIQNIAHEFNFADQAFLCKYFKQRCGFSPSEYRKDYKK
jgi:AraC family transcriptional regulator, transcriptional activator of pobA